MKALPLFIFLTLALGLCAQAGSVVCSPDRAEVSRFSTVKWKQLRRLPGTGAIVASITFSNEHYVSDHEPLRNERVDFALPGVQWDAHTGAFTMKTASRERTAVAVIRHRLPFEEIELLPGARLCLVRTGGAVTVQLVSGQAEPLASRTVEFIGGWPD